MKEDNIEDGIDKMGIGANDIVDRIEVGVAAVDRSCRVLLWNRFMAIHSGLSADAVIGRDLFECFPYLSRPWLEKKIESVFVLKSYAFTAWEHRPYLFRFPHYRPITGNAERMYQNCVMLPLKDAAGEVRAVCITVFDVTDTALYQQRLMDVVADLRQQKAQQQILIRKLEEAQNQLLQSEKMASIGQLAAGVAHEINNPTGFVNSNLGSLQRYVTDLFSLIDAYERLEAVLPAPQAAEIKALKAELDINYLREDVPSLIRESLDGIQRVRRIVQDLKNFSHVDESEWQAADLEKGLDSTLNVVWNELKYKCRLVKEYAGISPIECLASQLNQVFMNLLVNAAQAIEESGTITLRTGETDAEVWVEVEDSGKGIPAENLKRIFEPFFTTKPVGKGTGLGLSVSWNIVQKHGGRIEVDSEVGRGTRFRVRLPRTRTGAA